MSETNNREEARVLLKKITDFNVSNNYYQKEIKHEVARDVKKLLFIDDPTIRQFLVKWLLVTKDVAREFDLMGTNIEVNKDEEETSTEEKGEEKDETEEEDASEKESAQPAVAEESPTNEIPAKETTQEQEIAKLPENRVYTSYLNRASDLMLDVLLED